MGAMLIRAEKRDVTAGKTLCGGGVTAPRIGTCRRLTRADRRASPPRGAESLSYTVLRQGSGWALRVDLDSAWLDAPGRAWPVRVDPSFQKLCRGVG